MLTDLKKILSLLESEWNFKQNPCINFHNTLKHAASLPWEVDLPLI